MDGPKDQIRIADVFYSCPACRHPIESVLYSVSIRRSMEYAGFLSPGNRHVAAVSFRNGSADQAVCRLLGMVADRMKRGVTLPAVEFVRIDGPEATS